MKQLLFSLSLLLFLSFATSCETEPVTGSDDVIEFNNITISVDTTYAFGNSFRAEGTVTNTGNSSITPLWYLEGSFFRDSGSFKMGGGNTSFSFSLGSGQSTGWALSFSSDQYLAPDNPEFRVDELRVYKNEEDDD